MEINFEMQLHRNSYELLHALTHVDGLRHITEIGRNILGNPFVISDISMTPIAVSSNILKDDDPLWNVIASSGYVSFEMLSYYEIDKFNLAVKRNKYPFFHKHKNLKYPRIVGKAEVGSKQIATIVVCEHERPFKENDLELVSLLCNAVSIEMQKNKFIHHSRGLLHENFIEDLLGKKIKDSEVIEERKKILGLDFKKNLFVLVIDINDFDRTKFSIIYLKNEFEKMLSNSKAIVHDEKIVLVISANNENSFFKSELDALKSFLKGNSMYAGLSRCYHNLQETEEHYSQALEAIKLGKLINKNIYLFKYEDYVIYHIVDKCSKDRDLKKYCHPSLLTLMEYDKQNSTSYVHYLYTYIVNLNNHSEAANFLHIHRNTMIYRMNKIEEIMNVDLNDINILLHLHMSFKLLEYMKMI